MGANGIQREAELSEKGLQRKRHICCNFTRALVRIAAGNGALAEQSSIYLTCLCKKNLLWCLKINNYWEQLGSLCVKVSVFASVSVCSCIFVSVFSDSELAAQGNVHILPSRVIYLCDSFALMPLTDPAVSVGIQECQLCFRGWINVVTMSLGQYARVSPSAGNTTPHYPYCTAHCYTEKCYEIHTYTPTAFSMSGVDASICELASVFSIFHRLLSWAYCVAVLSDCNQLQNNGFKWEVKCTWLVICASSD